VNDRRQGPRQQQQGDGEAPAAPLALQSQRHRDPEQEFQRDGDEGEDQCHLHRVPEAWVPGKEDVVGEPDEALDAEHGDAALEG